MFQEPKRLGSRMRKSGRDTTDERARKKPQPGHACECAEPTAPARYVHEAGIPPQKFITTQTRDYDLETRLLRRFRNEPSVHTVDRGLVHGLQNGGEILDELPLTQGPYDVVRPVMLAHACSQWRLVLRCAMELFER